MGRPLSGKTAPKGRMSLIERFGGTVSRPSTPTPTGETISTSQQMTTVQPAQTAPAVEPAPEKKVESKNITKKTSKKAVAPKTNTAPALTVIDNTPRPDRNSVIAEKKAALAAAREARKKETSEREAKMKEILDKE